MSAEENKAAFRRIPEEVLNAGNLDLADELFAADYVEHAPVPPGTPPGLAGFKAFVTAFRAAFPDLHYTVGTILAEGDLTAGNLTGRGTHRGEFMGITPTGRQFASSGMSFYRITDSKVSELWVQADLPGLLQQLGAAPGPAQAT